MALIGLSLLFLLSFTECCDGLGILPEGPVDGILGKTLTLNTLYTKKPNDILVWAFSDGNELNNVATLRPNGPQVMEAYTGRASVNSTNGYLTINSLKPEDSGDYSLTIITDQGTLTGDIKVRVQECCDGLGILPEGPVDVILGKTLTLNTLYTKKPNDILVWVFSDGKELKNVVTMHPRGVKVNEAYTGRASVNSTNGYLTINSLKPEDSGDYSLTILTDQGTLTGDIKVRVVECCDGLGILPEGPVDGILGKTLTLNTLYTKKPNDILVWAFSDGKELKNVATLLRHGVKVNKAYLGRASVNSTTGYLTINSLKPEDSRNYSLTIITDDGTLTGEIKVRVVECCDGLGILPEGPLDGILGKTLTLNTLHTKKPNDILVWAFSDGKELKNVATLRPNGPQVNEAYTGRASVNSTTGYLTINSLKPEDSGDYSLTIITDQGTLNGDIKVRVVEPFVYFPLRTLGPPTKCRTTQLRCSAAKRYLTRRPVSSRVTRSNDPQTVVADNRLH